MKYIKYGLLLISVVLILTAILLIWSEQLVTFGVLTAKVYETSLILFGVYFLKLYYEFEDE